MVLLNDPGPWELLELQGAPLGWPLDFDAGLFGIRQLHPTNRQWYLAGVFANAHGAPRLVELTIRPSGHRVSAPPLTSTALRGLSLNLLYEAAIDWLNNDIEGHAFFEAQPQRGGNRARPSDPLRYFARFAEDYVKTVEYGTRQPIQDLARRHRITEAKARWNVARARELGLLTRVGQGRKGGSLTTKGRRALDG